MHLLQACTSNHLLELQCGHSPSIIYLQCANHWNSIVLAKYCYQLSVCSAQLQSKYLFGKCFVSTRVVIVALDPRFGIQ